jgi:parallel beta-helix repeat protein
VQVKRLRQVLVGCTLITAVIAFNPMSASAATVTVHSGESIQAAIDAASPGTTINVDPGTYTENLFIGKDGINLVGHHSTLTPPGSPTSNLCVDGSNFPGICVVGQVDQNFNLVKRVQNVVIAGFKIQHFSTEGIFAYGAAQYTVQNNVLNANGGYGTFALNSKGIRYLDNTATGNGDAGLYIGESAEANARVIGNTSSGNDGEGLLFRDSRGGLVESNTFTKNCIGLLALDTGVPINGGQVTIRKNTITTNNRFCSASDDAPPLGGMGLGIGGDDHVLVQNNTIDNNVQQPNTALPGGGIVLFDTSGFGGRAPSNNTIQNNSAHGNQPFDIFDDGSGTGNSFSGNNCNTSNNGACGV